MQPPLTCGRVQAQELNQGSPSTAGLWKEGVCAPLECPPCCALFCAALLIVSMMAIPKGPYQCPVPPASATSAWAWDRKNVSLFGTKWTWVLVQLPSEGTTSHGSLRRKRPEANRSTLRLQFLLKTCTLCQHLWILQGHGGHDTA